MPPYICHTLRLSLVKVPVVVCLWTSVHLSHAGIVPKWLNHILDILYRMPYLCGGWR